MQRMRDKRLKQFEAARMLGISIRQIKRVFWAFKAHGALGLVSRRRGRPSNNRLDPGTVQTAIDLIYERYQDFGPTLAHEKLTEVHGLKLSDESVRRLMIKEGLWKPKCAKKPPVHQMRERRACYGELVQIDGSDHDWFEGRAPRCTLLVYIDDPRGIGRCDRGQPRCEALLNANTSWRSASCGQAGVREIWDLFNGRRINLQMGILSG